MGIVFLRNIFYNYNTLDIRAGLGSACDLSLVMLILSNVSSHKFASTKLSGLFYFPSVEIVPLVALPLPFTKMGDAMMQSKNTKYKPLAFILSLAFHSTQAYTLLEQRTYYRLIKEEKLPVFEQEHAKSKFIKFYFQKLKQRYSYGLFFVGALRYSFDLVDKLAEMFAARIAGIGVLIIATEIEVYNGHDRSKQDENNIWITKSI